jgi:hypothetical protein
LFAFVGSRRHASPVGAGVGVRHLPPECLIRRLGWHGEIDISRELSDIVGDGEGTVQITDSETAAPASRSLVELVDAHAMPFAQSHASIEAMVSFIAGGGQVDRDEEFGYELIPAVLAASGQTDQAHAALAEFSARPRTHPEETARYSQFVDLLLGWMENPTPLG